MLSTVEENLKHYTQQQYKSAKIARELYQKVGHTSIKDNKKIIKMNEMKNCTVTMEDIDVCENIFGTDIYTLKGKIVCTKVKSVVND